MRNYLPAILCSLREDAGLSRTEVARQLGISVSSIRAYELGKQIPPRTVLLQLAKAYRVSYWALDSFYPQKPENTKKESF